MHFHTVFENSGESSNKRVACTARSGTVSARGHMGNPVQYACHLFQQLFRMSWNPILTVRGYALDSPPSRQIKALLHWIPHDQGKGASFQRRMLSGFLYAMCAPRLCVLLCEYTSTVLLCEYTTYLTDILHRYCHKSIIQHCRCK